MATKDEVTAFTALAKNLIASGNVFFVMRPKNKETLQALGMTKAAALNDLARLALQDYCGGPELDRDRDGRVCWKFGLVVATTEVYIKLVIDEGPNPSSLTVLSFHQAERPLSYPLR